ncbi:hypothetical protein ACP4OV_017640 [Aristida adscensionis]
MSNDAELGEVPDEEVDEEELNAVEAFKLCHTSRKKGISDAAREAVESMETLQAESVAAGEPPRPSAEAVSRVLSQSSCISTFLKNAGIQFKPSQPKTETERVLREELAAEKQAAASLVKEVDELKKKSEAADEKLEKTQREFEEFKKTQQENNALLRRILMLNGAGNSNS